MTGPDLTTGSGTRPARLIAPAPGCGWRLLLPPGWVSLPTKPEAGHAAVRALLDRQFRALPRDQVARTRIDVDRALRRLLADARQAGAEQVHAHAPEVWHTGVDYLIPLADSGELLVLAFATITEPVVEEVVALFDAIAGSLQPPHDARPSPLEAVNSS